MWISLYSMFARDITHNVILILFFSFFLLSPLNLFQKLKSDCCVETKWTQTYHKLNNIKCAMIFFSIIGQLNINAIKNCSTLNDYYWSNSISAIYCGFIIIHGYQLSSLLWVQMNHEIRCSMNNLICIGL